MQKKNYGNSIYFIVQKYNLPKNPLNKPKIIQDIITL